MRNPVCHYCGVKATTRDHIIPVARRGGGGFRAFVDACEPCNYARASTPYPTFAQSRGVPRELIEKSMLRAMRIMANRGRQVPAKDVKSFESMFGPVGEIDRWWRGHVLVPDTEKEETP